ncbi:MAG TPA: RNA methyltransferase [Pyrinomonadaceae bacterium]|nr:RNA methyltransferase [Pyrinomonadaceae bacterium]
MLITSRDNSLLRQARAVRDGKEDGLIYVEGLRLCEEALRSGLRIEAVIYSEELAAKEKAAPLITELTQNSNRAASVSEKLLESISYTKTPQGVVALASRPDSTLQSFESKQKEPQLLVVMHRINNPVNVGAILRTAEAAGATGVIATAHTSDPLSPKSLRGAMGSAFRLPIWFGTEFREVVSWCSQRGVRTICADVHAKSRYEEVDWRGPSALILGPESNGLSDEEIALADDAVTIPMHGNAESLNVAVAAGVVLYEAARQRGYLDIR